MTRISVLLPVYNAQPFLRVAIQSILVQTVSDFELLVIDDGSTDGSLAVISTMAKSDPRIRFSSRENRGLVATLNEMLDKAGSPMLARMDADDVAAPNRFERQLEAFEKDRSLLAVGSDVQLIDSEGRPLLVMHMPHTHEQIDEYTRAIVHGSGMCHPAMMFRREAFDLAGRYRAEFWPAEDADLVLRIAEKGKVANLPAPLLLYRTHANSIGHQQAARQRDAVFRAVSEATSRRSLPPPDPSLRELPAHERQKMETSVARDVKWAWWALQSGNVATARSLALRAVRHGPLSRAAWRVLACALRGH